MQSKYNDRKNILLDIGLTTDEKKLPSNNIQKTIDQYEQYLSEKDASDKYRLIFTINPVCTNILFNHLTEIVKDEGANTCTYYSYSTGHTFSNNPYLSYKIGSNNTNLFTTGLIRDTAYSYPDFGGLTYHCGYNIFNNHYFRNKEFAYIGYKASTSKTELPDEFNQFNDYVRNMQGYLVKHKLEHTNGEADNPEHIYFPSTFKSFTESIEDNLIEKDGWIGFRNPTRLEVKNVKYTKNGITKWVSINKCLNDNKAWEFIDMYPDRTLFSFIPKKNKSRNRNEKNWDYCITYPYKNYTDNILVTSKECGTNGILSKFTDTYGNEITDIKKIVVNQETEEETSDENRIIYIRTVFRNNLTDGDTVNLVIEAIIGKNTKVVEIPDITIQGVGLNGYDKNYYYTIRQAEINHALITLNDFISENEATLNLYTRRVVSGRVCKYYFRIFRRLPNFKNTKVSYENTITEEDINDNIMNEFNSSLNRLGFSTNAYNDKIAQIVYSDDIVTTGLRDNLGRVLSEIYLTIVKTNRGHDLWYSQKMYKSASVEYSHCFGDVTSGVEMPTWQRKYNVHCIYKLSGPQLKETDWTDSETKKLYPEEEMPLESGITISGSSLDEGEFLGDICELDEINCQEYVLEDVYHRFNTVQRELVSYEFKNMEHDEIFSALPETVIKEKNAPAKTNSFNGKNQTKIDIDSFSPSDTFDLSDFDSFVQAESINNGISDPFYRSDITYTSGKYYDNIAPEGYYYKPHYKILLKEFEDDVNEGYHTIVNFDTLTIKSKNDNILLCQGTTDKNYYFEIGNTIYLNNKNDGKRYEGVITNVDKTDFKKIEFNVSFNVSFNIEQGWLAVGNAYNGKTYEQQKEIGNERNYTMACRTVCYFDITETTVISAPPSGIQQMAVLYDKNKTYSTNAAFVTTSLNLGKYADKYKYFAILYVSANGAYKTPLSPSDFLKKGYVFFKPNSEEPLTAYDYGDTTGKYVWKDIKKNINIASDSELYDSVFTNDAHYFHKNINFYLRRQDPYGLYGLNLLQKKSNDAIIQNLQLLDITGENKDVSNIEYTTEDTTIC